MQERPFEINLALELVRVTESAAIGAGRWMGRGDKIAADQAAVDAMRSATAEHRYGWHCGHRRRRERRGADAVIGERIGNGNPPLVDVAVDPIDGTTLLSKGLPNALGGPCPDGSGGR